MKNKKLNAVQVWKQFEDVLAPRLRLSVIERAVYSHLLRHSLLEGKRRLRFSVIWLARNLALSRTPVRNAVHRLDELRALRILERSKAGHVVEMRLPEGVRAASDPKTGPGGPAKLPPGPSPDEPDFLKTFPPRPPNQARDGGRWCSPPRQPPGRLHRLDT